MRQLMHSFKGQAAPQDILEAVRRGDIAAFCLFRASNIESPAQVRELTDSLRRAAQEGRQLPPIIGVDQEGGQLIAITGGATELPGNMALGATRSPELAEQAGRVLARELLAMGINMDFAPSLDVNVNPANPVIGIRSFGDDPALVVDLGTALIRGMQNEGLLATAKHFPGHGDTAADTHKSLPVIPHDLERIHAVELAPFRAAIKEGVEAIITAHVIFSALDGDNAATLSPIVMEGLLRREMGFNGLIITDAMDMWAVAQRGREQCVREALEAGADLVMLAHLPDQLELNNGIRSMERVDSLKRIRAAQARIPTSLPPFDVVGCAEHQAIAQTIADRSITLVRDKGQLPLRPYEDELITVITPRPVDLTPADTSSSVQISLADAIRKRHRRVSTYELAPGVCWDEVNAALKATEDADIVIVGTIAIDRDPGQANLIETLQRRGQTPIVVALRTPYDLIDVPMVDTYLCAYGIRPVTMEAVARVLFGEIEAKGILPCAIPGLVEQANAAIMLR